MALSALCENPARKTGLTTMFHALVEESLKQFNDVDWLVFVGPGQEWRVQHPRVQVDRHFPANDHRLRRLLMDQCFVSARAARKGADALVTVGFVPLVNKLPVAMHVLSLHHLNGREIGVARSIYRRWLASSSWRKADLVITNSMQTRAELLSRLPELADRSIVSYEGLDTTRFHPDHVAGEESLLKCELGVEPGYVLWVSNFYAYKRADQVLDAYARLEPELRDRHPLVFVGGDWEGGRGRARAHVERLGLERDAHFLSWVDDAYLPALYRHAAAFVLATEEETFGRCVIEAMACGTPCLVSDLPITRETTGAVIDLIDFSDPETASASLRDTLRRGKIAGRQERVAAAGRFSFQQLARERVLAIRRLLGGGSARG